MRLLLAIVVLAGCYAPVVPRGSPCDAEHPCPSGLVCAGATGTCEPTDTDAGLVPPDVLPDACSTVFDTCGDGIDQNCDGVDPTCVGNDLPGGATNITTGGIFTGDLLRARDDLAATGCNDSGGREVFYSVSLTASEFYYFDTFDSDFDTTLRVYPGTSCTNVSSATAPICSDDACNLRGSQLTVLLPSGSSCVVVDENAGSMTGSSSLRVIRGGRGNGIPLANGVATLTGDTCTSTNVWEPNIACSGAAGAKDIAYFFMACPGQTAHLDASTCTDVTSTHFDTTVYVRPASNTDLVCVDDSATCAARPDRTDGHPDGSILTDVQASGPGLFWLVVDGYSSGACGGYRLDVNLR